MSAKQPRDDANAEYEALEDLMQELQDKMDDVARLTRTIMFGWANNIASRHWTFYYMQTSEKKYVRYLLRTRCGKYGASCQWFSNVKTPQMVVDGAPQKYVSKMISPARGSISIPLSRFTRASTEEKEQILKAESEIEKLRSASQHLAGMSNKYLSFMQRARSSEILNEPDLVMQTNAPEIIRFDTSNGDGTDESE